MTEDRFDRNERLFGKEGQARLRRTQVVIMGTGGLGVCAAGQFRKVRERGTIVVGLFKGVLWSRFGVDRVSSHLWVPGIGG